MQQRHDEAVKRVMTAVLNDDMQLFKQFTDNEGFRQPQASIAFLEIDDIGAFLECDDVSGADWKHPPAGLDMASRGGSS